MVELNQTDFEVRLQLSSCCIGEKTADLLSKIKIGAKTVPCKLQDLQVAEIMLSYLKCYDTTLVEVLATGTIELNVIPRGTTMNIKVNGISISGTFNPATSTQSTEMIALTAQINTYQNVYTAVYDAAQGAFGKIVITSLYCDNLIMTATTSDSTITLTGLTGTCLTENCITELQMQSMFEWIAKKCNLCFQKAEFNYE